MIPDDHNLLRPKQGAERIFRPHLRCFVDHQDIEVEPANLDSELKVYANFLVYKNRAETEQDFFVGARKDVLRQVNGSWKIASRRLILDQTVILAKNVSIFF